MQDGAYNTTSTAISDDVANDIIAMTDSGVEIDCADQEGMSGSVLVSGTDLSVRKLVKTMALFVYTTHGMRAITSVSFPITSLLH